MIDAYVNWVWFRISGTDFDGTDFPHLRRHDEDLLARPAVQRALARHAEAAQTLRDEGVAVPLVELG